MNIFSERSAANLISFMYMESDAFEKLVERNCKDTGRRYVLSTLKSLAEAELELKESTYRAPREKHTLLKQILSRFLGPEIFQPKYDRLLAQALKKRERERLLEQRAREKTKRIAYESTPFVKIRQEAVGHGCFHHGVLASHYAHSRWVYDCGAWRRPGRQSLDKCISNFVKRCSRYAPDQGRLDLLFVSHFDADHVSGLKRLLQSLPGGVNTVVVPYLGSVGALAVLCEASVRNRCSNDLINQVVDPVGWFESRGALRVIQIRPSNRSRPGETPPMPDLPPIRDLSLTESGEDRFDPVALGPDRRIVQPKPRKSNSSKSVIAQAGTVIGVATPPRDEWIDWWFVPYVQPIPPAVQTALSRAAKQIAGVPPTNREFKNRLVRILSQKSGIKRLKRVYLRSGLRDANAISLSLYAGPRRQLASERNILQNDGSRPTRAAGWLLTGDSKLKESVRFHDWSTFFASAKADIGTLMLPHHGSEGNFNEQILDWLPHSRLFVTANADDKTRPNKSVTGAAKKRRAKIQKVSESRRTAITEISGPNDLAPQNFPHENEW
jgi:hypothetical protein